MTTDHRAEAERLLRHRNVSRAWPHIALHAIDRLADALAARLPQTPTPINPPSSAPAAPTGDDQAPVDPQAAPGPQKSAGRIGWLRLDSSFPFRYLARKVEGGWSGVDYDHNNGTPGWIDTGYPGATFTPLLDGFFVAPDGYGVPVIWQETDNGPEVMMRRASYNAALFDAVTGLMETREEA